MPTIFTQEQLGKDRVNGHYETPLKTVEYICNKILPYYKKGKKILDPSVGDGIFMFSLLQAGVDKNDLHGFDIDQDKVDKLQSYFPNVINFDATNPFPQKYDFIVGNPPYNGDESHFVRDNRIRLKKIFKEIAVKNTFSMISYQAIDALKIDGIFSMILSDAFLTNIYYKDFRLFLLRNTNLKELMLAPWKLFHGRSADVRTCIITASKKEIIDALFSPQSIKNNMVRLVDRVKSEDEYLDPKNVEFIKQDDFYIYPNTTFLIGIPLEIRKIFLEAKIRLGDFVCGGTGISTGNDKKYLRLQNEVKDNDKWVPYYKNGARKAYWYNPSFAIEKDYKKYCKIIPNYLIRNEKYFFKEGISCSSVGVRFSAAYMPEGCLFGVNANFFFSDKDTMLYTLGLLNSKFAWYFARKVLIRTNNISANYLRLMPYKEPSEKKKKEIVNIVQTIINKSIENESYDYTDLQIMLDEEFFKVFDLSKESIEEINGFCANFYDSL